MPPVLHCQAEAQRKKSSDKNFRREARFDPKVLLFFAGQCCRLLTGEGNSRTFQMDWMPQPRMASPMPTLDPVFEVYASPTLRCLSMIGNVVFLETVVGDA